MQLWHTPFLIWNQSVVLCPVLAVASWAIYRFLRRQVRWSGIPISWRISQFVVIHTVNGFGIVNKTEIDVFLELSCFFHDPADVGNLISGSSAFSRTSLNIREFMVHVLLKSGLESFEHYFTSVCDECSCAVVWAFFCFLPFLCIDHRGRLSYLSLLVFGILHSNRYIFPFLLCLSLLFSQLFERPPQTTILPFCISFSRVWSCSLSPVQCHEPSSIVLQALCLSDLIHWFYFSVPLCNHKGFYLGHIRMV